MSDNQKNEQKEKVVTKYDLKMQKRKEQKEREKRQERISTVIGILVVVALVCVVASFPLRTYLATHETYVEIDGEKITRVEFEYNYSLASGNYMSENAYFLSLIGLNVNSDFSSQMYSDTLTWGDFFAQLTVEGIVQNRALLKEAEAAGFTYDTTEEYAEFEQGIKDAAADAGMSVKEYVKMLYGSYATLDRIDDYIKEAMVLNAYYEQISEQKEPTEEEIDAYYQENTQSYDKVDYRLLSFDAELPTEPTELADTSATADTSAVDPTAADGSADAAYQPSEAEIAKAMADAKKLADAAEATVATAGTLMEGARSTVVAAAIRSWLFDGTRKAGDTAVIEDENAHRYFVVAFEKRYLDTTPTADLRVLITASEDGQALLDAWAAGEATEESFAQLCRDHSEDADTAADGGLYEALADSGMDEALSGWIYDSARKPGDTTVITLEEGNTFVFYYVGANEPEYRLSIRNTLLSTAMQEYLEEITQNIEVEDPKNRLAYLHVEETPATEEGDGTESSEATVESSAAQ